MLDTFGRDEFVGNFLNRPSFASERQHFHAVVVVKVDVQRRDDQLVVLVLNVRQRRLHVRTVVIINERDRAGDFVLAQVLIMLDQTGAYQIRHCYRAIRVPFLARHLVQLPGEVLWNRNRKPLNAAFSNLVHASNAIEPAPSVNEVLILQREIRPFTIYDLRAEGIQGRSGKLVHPSLQARKS